MSFTTKIKEEISKLEVDNSEYIAEMSAFVRNNASVDKNIIYLTTENSSIVKRLLKLFKEIYEVKLKIETTKNINLSKKTLYLLKVEERVDFILKALNYYDDNNNYLERPNDYIIDSIEEQRAYIRGVFLSQGSVNDPKTSRYHMELLIDKPEEAIFVQKVLNNFDMNAKLLNRDKGYMVYLKESEKISDFLKLIKAYNAVMYYENIRAYRDNKNKTNRLNNCEQANTDKIIETATKQVKDIEMLDKYIGIDLLDDKTKEACIYRLKYPEASLLELSNIISLETGKKITKSGLNHRFRKIKEMVEKYKKDN